jgi:hypothetical protein
MKTHEDHDYDFLIFVIVFSPVFPLGACPNHVIMYVYVWR